MSDELDKRGGSYDNVSVEDAAAMAFAKVRMMLREADMSEMADPDRPIGQRVNKADCQHQTVIRHKLYGKQCQDCGYTLAGLTSCPECGTQSTPKPAK